MEHASRAADKRRTQSERTCIQLVQAVVEVHEQVLGLFIGAWGELLRLGLETRAFLVDCHYRLERSLRRGLHLALQQEDVHSRRDGDLAVRDNVQ